MVTTQQAREWYDAQKISVRTKLQFDYGNEAEADREQKFYKWLRRMINKSQCHIEQNKLKKAV